MWHARRFVRERVRAARGYGGPGVWVLTATPGEAARGPATRCHETRDRECEGVNTPESPDANQSAKNERGPNLQVRLGGPNVRPGESFID